MATPFRTAALLRAIEGFEGENSGNREHAGTIDLLRQVKAGVEKGHNASATDSPGRREGQRIIHREMPSERKAFTTSEGNTKSNNPGSADQHDPVGDYLNTHHKNNRTLSGAAAVKTEGEVHSLAPTKISIRQAEMRRVAADQEKGRPDSKIKDVQGKGDGNKESMLGQAPPAKPERVTDATISKAGQSIQPFSSEEAKPAVGQEDEYPQARPGSFEAVSGKAKAIYAGLRGKPNRKAAPGV